MVYCLQTGLGCNRYLSGLGLYLQNRLGRRETMRGKWVGIALALAGVALVCAGLLQGQEMDVFNKARLVCMECIGLG